MVWWARRRASVNPNSKSAGPSDPTDGPEALVSLSDDMLSSILGFLDARTLAKAACLSRGFKTLVEDPSLWRNMLRARLLRLNWQCDDPATFAAFEKADAKSLLLTDASAPLWRPPRVVTGTHSSRQQRLGDGSSVHDVTLDGDEPAAAAAASVPYRSRLSRRLHVSR